MSNSQAQGWLGTGEMGKLILSMDWTKTPLGSIECWPQSLRTTVSLCLASNFPISLAWGPQHVQIYNDGYWPICGAKHPHSMGQDFSECWASAWPVVGDAFTRALAGNTSFLENQRMFLDRNGYLEETFFTFSFSPIRDETGIAGLFHPVTETTDKMLSERRTRALRDIANRAGKARTVSAACKLAARTLSDYQPDLPFVLFYLLDEHGTEARLTAASGLSHQSAASPDVVDLSEPFASAWPLAEVASSGMRQHVSNLALRFGSLDCGEYPESVKEAMVLPITPPGCERPIAILVAGVSSRLPLNETYRAFFDLLAAAVTTEVANARAYEQERNHAKGLAEIDRAKTTFFSNVSHEFRTPLSLILGPVEEELAELANPLPPARLDRLESVHRNSLRLLKLVNTLLDFSRTEAGRTQATYRPIDLSALTAELASVFRSAIATAGLTLRVDCAPLPEPIYVDPEMWEQVVLNLVSNAFKHTFEGGITVTVQWLDRCAELSVSDTGVGIPQTEMPRLFERFHRVNGAKSRTHEGTGIGLAVVKDLVGLHGGTIRAESKEDKGSTFVVTLPAGTAHLPPGRLGSVRVRDSTSTQSASFVAEVTQWLPQAAGAHRENSWPVEGPASEAAGPQANRRRPRILWADDNADMRSYVSRLLSASYDVFAVPDGLAALAAAQQGHPDLVLTDVMMPGLDGLGLLRGLRSDARTSMIPVILLSARTGQEAAIEGLDAGADDYIAKPFTSQELLARVRTHVEMARTRREYATQLEQANNDLEAFSYSVAHDLRTPLRGINGFSKILLHDCGKDLDERARDYLKRVCAGVQKMSDLIDGLLELSGISLADTPRESVSLTDLALGVISDLQKTQPARNVTVEIAPDLIGTGDMRLLRTVMANLLGNAWKYSAKQPEARIVFGVDNRTRETIFYVRDNGAGFDMAHAGRLYSPFQRLHTQSEFEGTGIGLAIVRRIVARHGGRIWAEAAPDEGATFYFTLEEVR